HVLFRDHDPLLNGVLGEWSAVPVIDASDDRRLVVFERLHQRDLNGVSHHETSRHAESKGHEKNEQARSVAWRGFGLGGREVGHGRQDTISIQCPKSLPRSRRWLRSGLALLPIRSSRTVS